MSGATNLADEGLLAAIAREDAGEPTGGDRCREIVDCRGRDAAAANQLGGAGTETKKGYPDWRVSFAGIGNIHAVRAAHKALAALCVAGREAPHDEKSLFDSEHAAAPNDLEWGAKVEGTGWLSEIRGLLRCAWHVAAAVKRRRARVVIHCSHGWDRTSQVAALAQILLDARCRTQRGFARLVEKDFVAFGRPPRGEPRTVAAPSSFFTGVVS